MKVEIIDSNKSEEYFIYNGIGCINLNSIVKKDFNVYKINNFLQTIALPKNVNLCNLASLCYRLRIPYTSLDCVALVKQVAQIVKTVNPEVRLVQANIANCGEIDMLPFDKLYSIDEENSIIYINKVLKSCLNFLGYSDAQLGDLIVSVKNVMNYLPSDITKYVALQNNLTNQTYKMILELLN